MSNYLVTAELTHNRALY